MGEVVKDVTEAIIRPVSEVIKVTSLPVIKAGVEVLGPAIGEITGANVQREALQRQEELIEEEKTAADLARKEKQAQDLESSRRASLAASRAAGAGVQVRQTVPTTRAVSRLGSDERDFLGL